MGQAVIYVQGVKSIDARGVWPTVETWMTDALESSYLTPDCLLGWIEKQTAQLWLVHDVDGPLAAFVTQIEDAPLGSALSVVALGGAGMEDWLPGVEDTIAEFAREKGCRRVQLQGRRGWIRQLAFYGWREASVNMTKEL